MDYAQTEGTLRRLRPVYEAYAHTCAPQSGPPPPARCPLLCEVRSAVYRDPSGAGVHLLFNRQDLNPMPDARNPLCA